LPHCEERARFRSGNRDEFLIADDLRAGSARPTSDQI
jgi:hypothetical protein